jgi:hypothetical protein
VANIRIAIQFFKNHWQFEKAYNEVFSDCGQRSGVTMAERAS